MCDLAECPLVSPLRATLLLTNDAMASPLITKGIGIKSYIASRATLGVLFLVLLSIPVNGVDFIYHSFRLVASVKL